MWRLLIFLLFLIVSVWFGLEVVRHPGYLLIVYQPWLVQMPIWFALLATILILALFYFLITSVDRIQFLWFRLKNWLHIRREHQSYSKTQRGISALIEGRWKKAEHLALTGVNDSFEPLVNYLTAAEAAQEQNAYERRDSYIQKAYQVAPKAELAIGLTKAELELNQGDLASAAVTLDQLRKLSPRHPRVLKMLEIVYVRLADWENLEKLLPSMRKAKMLTSEEYDLFEKNLYSELFRNVQHKSVDELHNMWNDLPRSVRKNPDVIYEYVKQLLRVSSSKEVTNEVEDLIRKTLKNSWHAELAEIYGTLPFNNLNRQLVIVGAWLKMYGPKPQLLLTLGKLCVRVQLWGKAKDYFEKCLEQGPNAQASLEYGKLLEYLNDPQEAMQIYRNGLEIGYGVTRSGCPR